MKDEAAGIPMLEFIGLWSKIYSYIKDNEKGNKTGKGVKKNVIKKDIKNEHYKDTLFEKKQLHHKMKTTKSNLYKLSSYKVNEISL